MDYDIHIRDPLYGFIGFTKEEKALINTPVFQRLRRIGQLAFTNYVYPSACHNRFEHSLGVVHIATRMGHKIKLDEDELKILRYAALLHDTGHGPYSHFFESVLKMAGSNLDHEDITHKIILEDENISSVLGEHTETVAELFDDKNESLSRAILSSNIDADRIDYLRRDSYHTGVSYGNFDIERIIHTLTTIEASDTEKYLAIEVKGVDALENYRLSRFLMHTQVYQHHTCIIAEEMLKKAVESAIDDDKWDIDWMKNPPSDFLEKYYLLDDASLMNILKTCDSDKSSKIVVDLENRNLFKRILEIDLNLASPLIRLKLMKPENSKIIEEYLCNTFDCNQDSVIAHTVNIENSLMKSSHSLNKEGKNAIMVKDTKGRAHDLDNYSIFEGDTKPRMLYYIFCSNEAKDKIGKIDLETLNLAL